MAYIRLVSLNICNDDDLIYGTKAISKSDIDKFIKHHALTKSDLINDLNRFADSYIDIPTNTNINLNINSNFNSNIRSYYIRNNRIISISVQLDNKIRYINNLDPVIVDNYMTNKKNILYQELLDSDVDFALLQECDFHYLPTKHDFETILADYNIISPIHIKSYAQSHHIGSMSNHILYKKTFSDSLICSYLTDYGTVAKLNINDNIIKIISGRWAPLTQNKNIRIEQFKSINNIKTPFVFMGDTNLRSSEKIYNMKCDDIMNLYGLDDVFTINKYTNPYFNDDYMYVSRYDRIYSKDIDFAYCGLFFNKPHDILKNKYRQTGFISDHFGLVSDIIL